MWRALLIAMVLPVTALASEEEYLQWAEVRIVSPKRDDVGQVVFAAKLDGDKYKEVTIEAFGKKHLVPDELLAKLNPYPLNSLTTTHEAGYERLGGHTVHFKFKIISSDGRGGTIESKLILSVSKGRGLTITEPACASTSE